MELQRLKFLMEVQAKIDEWSNKLPPDDANLVKAKEQFFRLVTTEFKKNTTSEELHESPIIDKIALDTSTIRQVLELKKNTSIDFNFIDNEQVKNQLITDNLRMENPRWDLPREGVQRFYEFCVNAFYQIEELINYYYGSKFLTFIEFRVHFQSLNPEYNITDTKSNISDIEISQKIFIFQKSFFDFSLERDRIDSSILKNLRLIRNEDSHRCSIILKDKDDKLHNFIKYREKNYQQIRQLIVRICEVIRKDL